MKNIFLRNQKFVLNFILNHLEIIFVLLHLLVKYGKNLLPRAKVVLILFQQIPCFSAKFWYHLCKTDKWLEKTKSLMRPTRDPTVRQRCSPKNPMSSLLFARKP